MFDIGPEKLLVVFVAVLVFLGPKQLPEAARTIGSVLRRFRSLQETIRSEMSSSLEQLTDSQPPEDSGRPPRSPH